MDASAVYQPKFLKLFVLNTAKNIDAMETILVDLKEEALLQRSQQVEVEAKFVEFSEGALEELGFDWNVYGNEINNELRMNSVGGTYTQGTWPVIGSASVQTLADVDGTPVYTKTVEGYVLVDPAAFERTRLIARCPSMTGPCHLPGSPCNPVGVRYLRTMPATPNLFSHLATSWPSYDSISPA